MCEGVGAGGCFVLVRLCSAHWCWIGSLWCVLLCTVALVNRGTCCEAHLLSGTGGSVETMSRGRDEQGGLRLNPSLILAQPPAFLSASPPVFFTCLFPRHLGAMIHSRTSHSGTVVCLQKNLRRFFSPSISWNTVDYWDFRTNIFVYTPCQFSLK